MLRPCDLAGFLGLFRPFSGLFGLVQAHKGSVKSEGEPGIGIGGYDLKSTADCVFALDYNHVGKLDHLALYCPATGTIWILRNNNGNFEPVYHQVIQDKALLDMTSDHLQIEPSPLIMTIAAKQTISPSFILAQAPYGSCTTICLVRQTVMVDRGLRNERRRCCGIIVPMTEIVMCLAWLQANKPRSQALGFTSQAKPNRWLRRGFGFWLGMSEAKAKGLGLGFGPPENGCPSGQFGCTIGSEYQC
ncbi:hypothetical protein B0H10DRAFT_2184266 [Mycena sp. CBHHK59/15]|nr:hypothetical protein B0H10DRAFT_2184266 [Mycena sp. CBHHK59/15]